MDGTLTRDMTSHGSEETTVMPPQHAEEDFDDLYDFLSHHDNDSLDTPCLQDGEGKKIPVPKEIFDVLIQVSEAMRQGKAVSVVPVSMTLTTSQAADMLGVSRQTLVRLLEKGGIPFERPSRHRKVRLTDLLAYKRQRQVEKHHALDEMTRMAVEDDLYEDTSADYEQVLPSVRKGE
ncbi:helix-turn-helix domain-containing protein [Bifidobacterium mongoliense]|uniref:helix-turn-helix domain-containing protein n=1 Tax=Bifidobacterium mongoliense TaxID=518643 RepID=UPI0030EE63BF